MANLEIFNPQPAVDQAELVARHLPVGRVWDRAFDPSSNLYQLLLGLSFEFFRIELLFKILAGDVDIVQTANLITEWEQSVGLPDDCLNIQKPIEIRREQVLQKFSNLGGVQMAEDFVRVAAIFGYEVSVRPGSVNAVFPMTFPVGFTPSGKIARHIIYVDLPDELATAEAFPYVFLGPVPPATEGGIPFYLAPPEFLVCIFKKLAPANVDVKFNFVEPAAVGAKLTLESAIPEDEFFLLLEGPNSSYLLLEGD